VVVVAGGCVVVGVRVSAGLSGAGSSRWRIVAVRAGDGSGPATAYPYGDWYVWADDCRSPTVPATGKPSGSDLVDLPRLLLPDDELDWLALVGAVGVIIEEMGMRDAGGGAVALISCAAGK
jgi:hypothetical protein